MSIQIKNRHSITPIAAFFSKWELSITNILSLTSCMASPDFILNQVIPQSDNRLCVIKIMHLVKYLYILLRAACPPREDASEEEQNNCWFPLHASILVPSCPWSIRYLMLRIHPEQIILKDSYGNFAIVYLATMENHNCSYCSNTNDSTMCTLCIHDRPNLASSLLILSMIFQMLRECPTLISNTLSNASSKGRKTQLSLT